MGGLMLRKITLGIVFLILSLLTVSTVLADTISINNARVFAEDGVVRVIVDVDSNRFLSGVKTKIFFLGADFYVSDGPYKLREGKQVNQNFAVEEEFDEETLVMITVGKGKNRKVVYRYIEFD